MSSEVKYYIDLFFKKQNGYNIFSEPIENKSSKLVELFDILDNLFKELQKKEANKHGNASSSN